MRRRFIILFPAVAIAAAFALALPGAAQQFVERIAAVVNDEIISTSDIQARLRLDLLAAGLEPSSQNQQRLMPSVLRTLINEKIQLQEANRFNVEVEDRDVAEAIGRIAGQNGMSDADMRTLLARNSVPISALEDSLRSTIAWTRLTQRRFAQNIEIGEEEIEEVIDRYRSNQGRPEYLLAEIFLAVDSIQEDRQVRQLAQQLADQIRQGAPFARVARQFSESGGAANGGDIGWVVQGQIDPALDSALTQMQPGQLSPPIRSPTGYHILLVRDRRLVAMSAPNEAVVTLYQLVLAIPDGTSRADAQSAIDILEEASRTIRSCEALAQRAQELGVGDQVVAGRGPVDALPQPIRELLEGRPDGIPTQAIRVPGGAGIFMTCDREESGLNLPSREQIAEALARERLSMLQRRYLRDLRNASYIELRV